MELNPKIRNRCLRAFELIPQKNCRLLDLGCSTGGFLGYLHKKACCRELYGCDVSSEAIAEAQYSYPGIKFVHISSKIPFPNSYFDVVTMLDVLEHVPNEHDVLSEITRVLVKGGVLILSVPHRGLFAWCDSGNIKFRFPTLHRMFYYYILQDMETYNKKFRRGSNGLFGDISISDSMWHKHYSVRELVQFLEPNFEIVKIDLFSLFTPILANLNYVYRLFFKRDSAIFRRLLNADCSKEASNFSYNVILKARKK